MRLFSQNVENRYISEDSLLWGIEIVLREQENYIIICSLRF